MGGISHVSLKVASALHVKVMEIPPSVVASQLWLRDDLEEVYALLFRFLGYGFCLAVSNVGWLVTQKFVILEVDQDREVGLTRQCDARPSFLIMCCVWDSLSQDDGGGPLEPDTGKPCANSLKTHLIVRLFFQGECDLQRFDARSWYEAAKDRQKCGS